MSSICWKIALLFLFPSLACPPFWKFATESMFVHHEGLVVAYTWNREKQMFVALGKEFDMVVRYNAVHYILKLALHYMLPTGSLYGSWSRHCGYPQRPRHIGPSSPLLLNLPLWLSAWVGKTELGCFKAECCNICIVSFSRKLKIVLVTF